MSRKRRGFAEAIRQALRDAAQARQSLEKALQKIMARTESKEALQDSYFTEREGRLVLPVKAEAKSRLEGIVHDSSGSGQTLFVEPTATIPLNNKYQSWARGKEKNQEAALTVNGLVVTRTLG